MLRNKYLVKKNSYIINLENVEFITYKENEAEPDTYWIKFHIGSKETRFICDSLDELKTILRRWTLSQGNEVAHKNEELV